MTFVSKFFFNVSLYLQSVPIRSANVVNSCRRAITITLLYVKRSESSCDLGSETYKLNLKKTKFTITTITY
jgi:hypothetical protein